MSDEEIRALAQRVREAIEAYNCGEQICGTLFYPEVEGVISGFLREAEARGVEAMRKLAARAAREVAVEQYRKCGLGPGTGAADEVNRRILALPLPSLPACEVTGRAGNGEDQDAQ